MEEHSFMDYLTLKAKSSEAKHNIFKFSAFLLVVAFIHISISTILNFDDILIPILEFCCITIETILLSVVCLNVLWWINLKQKKTNDIKN